ncbi:hypothetical protein ABIB51_002487 [Arthrobacter sp. UYCu712]
MDRLRFKGTVIDTGTDSYRLAHTLNGVVADLIRAVTADPG